jgi:hypothetical protein
MIFIYLPGMNLYHLKLPALIQRLEIKPTKTTLGIIFDSENHYFEFSGKSYPTNAVLFFQPLVEWVNEYISFYKKEKILIHLYLTYFNTTSSTYLFRIMEQFNSVNKKYKNVTIHWYYEEDEDDVLECWKSLISELELSFQMIRIVSGSNI